MVKERDNDRTQTGASMTRRISQTPTMWDDPFHMMNRFAGAMNRVFDDFRAGAWLTPGTEPTSWMPQIEVSERDDQLLVRADLPGMKKEDVHIDVTDGALVIHGERRHEHQEGGEKQGYIRSERSYGRFYRAIPLPDGIDEDQVKARFRNGVLEVSVPLPQQRRGRRIEIEEGETTRGSSTRETSMRGETARAMREGGSR